VHVLGLREHADRAEPGDHDLSAVRVHADLVGIVPTDAEVDEVLVVRVRELVGDLRPPRRARCSRRRGTRRARRRSAARRAPRARRRSRPRACGSGTGQYVRPSGRGSRSSSKPARLRRQERGRARLRVAAPRSLLGLGGSISISSMFTIGRSA
jgi:hypothetical protein